jgi:hypothetical protein
VHPMPAGAHPRLTIEADQVGGSENCRPLPMRYGLPNESGLQGL